MKEFMFTCFVLLLIGLSSCKQDKYFEDGGTHQERFDGTIMEYLDSKAKRPIDPFDTLVQVIRFAGLEEEFKNETITFFAPPDPSIRKVIKDVNSQLYYQGLDTITSFTQVNPNVWRYFLTQYMIKGDYGLIDFPQIDTMDLNAFDGQLFQTYNPEETLNVGVVYHDLKNEGTVIKYKGARQILISYIPEGSQLARDWFNVFIASSNIRPTNGRVHVINYNRHTLGFNSRRFVVMALEHGIAYNNRN